MPTLIPEMIDLIATTATVGGAVLVTVVISEVLIGVIRRGFKS